MQGLIIRSSTGEALSSEEIAAAHRLADTHKEMRAGVIRQVDALTGATVEYHAHKRMALTTPGTGFDYVKMLLPNPIPYRGVSIGVVSGASVIGPSISYLSSSSSSVPGFYGSEESSGTASYSFSAGGQAFTSTGSYSYSYSGWVGYGPPPQTPFTETTSYSNYPLAGRGVANGSSNASRGSSDGPVLHSGNATYTPFSETALYAQAADSSDVNDYLYVVASNGEVLAREVQQTVMVDGVERLRYHPSPSDDPVWSGGSPISMYDCNTNSPHADLVFHHNLNFDVPEDCVYPLTPIPPAYPEPSGQSQWNADWLAGQASLKLRRKLWFKKSHDTVLAQLKDGSFALPITWDYAIKRNAPVSGHTYRPILMDVTYEDSDPVVVETFPVITTTIARETTFSYTIDVIQPDGSVVTEERSLVLVGSKKTVTTESYIAVTDRTLTWDRFNFQNWYVPSTDPSPGSAYENFYKHRLLRDKSQYGLGLIWSGEDMASSWLADSLYGYPANPLDFVTFTPPIPAYSNTLIGTAHQFILDYRKDVPIQYNKDAPGDTEWNDSAMVDKETITIIPFSPVKKGESLGMFWDSSSLDPDNTGTKTFDSLLIFGSAQFHYVYATGEILFDKWIPLTDADGNEVETRKVNVAGTEPESNCIVKYGKLIWPDVIKAGKEHMKKLASGEVEDPEEAILMKAIIDAAKSA